MSLLVDLLKFHVNFLCLLLTAVKVVFKLICCVMMTRSVRTGLANMATKSLVRALIPSYLPLVRRSLLNYKEINLKIISRNIRCISRCNFSNAASQMKEVDEATENSDPRKTKIPILGEYENRNPRNEEYFGFNKPRGYSTQVYRVDFYNK